MWSHLDHFCYRARNFLVFQGDVEAAAQRQGKDPLSLPMFGVRGSLAYRDEYEALAKEKAQKEDLARCLYTKRRNVINEKKRLGQQTAEAQMYRAKEIERRHMEVEFYLFQFHCIAWQAEDARRRGGDAERALGELRLLMLPNGPLPAPELLLGNLCELFEALATSQSFLALWTRRGLRGPLLLPPQRCVRRVLSLEDVAAGLSAAAAAGEHIPAALGLQLGSGETLNSELPPVRSPAELRRLLRFGTVFLNAASRRWRALASVCLAASSALGLPTNINVYVTAPGRAVSTPAHADRHDVIILQSTGQKRWRVYRPLPRQAGGGHPWDRGKHGGPIRPEELGTPLLDVTLRSGECLFVPAGFPHETGTPGGGQGAEVSVHLTLGISVADCGVTYGALRGQLLLELGEPGADEECLDDEAFWSLYQPLPLGCLAPRGLQGERAVATIAEATAALVRQTDLRCLEPLGSEEEASLRDAAEVVVGRWLRIQDELLAIYRSGYAEVAGAPGSGPVALGLAGSGEAGGFHAPRARPPGDPLVDPATLAAAASVGSFCAFLREHLPRAEAEPEPPEGAPAPLLYEEPLAPLQCEVVGQAAPRSWPFGLAPLKLAAERRRLRGEEAHGHPTALRHRGRHRERARPGPQEAADAAGRSAAARGAGRRAPEAARQRTAADGAAAGRGAQEALHQLGKQLGVPGPGGAPDAQLRRTAKN
ncbi:unnamed protein product [Prorocentrum cordatum]|uniref:Bifunctional lysine-specific demethylase and histidyl-hydroxylase n=1 Tax=Prorocentrum cordatum TaxID=2364126 RepID=A0ABN9XDL9_9DINO|nr:unnamed protein product [Polarella glacialis]